MSSIPSYQRRPSTDPPATTNVHQFPSTDLRVNGGNLSERSASLDLGFPLAAGGRQGTTNGPISWGVGGAGTPRVRSAPHMAAPGGAIKVNRDVMSLSPRTRPRISVFMSSTAGRGGTKKIPPSPVTPLNGSPRAKTRSTVTSSSATHGRHGLQTANATSQRIKGLRIMVPRNRSQAEQRVVDSNPPVVAMGSRRSSSSSALEGPLAAPRLHRASSVGALTITGGGDLVSRSPVLSSNGSIIQSCELSEQVAGRPQRRNLVCKVIGSGSRFSRPKPGPH